MPDPRERQEQPRCDCGHRRIHHTALVRTRGSRGGVTGGIETMVPCSMPDCTCGEYAPVGTAVSSAADMEGASCAD